MANEWTMKTFLAEHDVKWETEISKLRGQITALEKENEYLRESYINVVQAFNEKVGDYDDTIDKD